MRKHQTIELEILSILAFRKPPDKSWYLSALHSKGTIVTQAEKELGLFPPEEIKLKARFSKSQVEQALKNLNNYGLVEIQKFGPREAAPISLTFWGFIQVLGILFQKNPFNNEKQLRLLNEITEINAEKLPGLFKKWSKLNPHFQESLMAKMREYFSGAQRNKSIGSSLTKKTHDLKNSQSKVIILKMICDDFINFIFVEKNSSFSDTELISLRKKLLNNPVEILQDRTKILCLLQNLVKKKKEFREKIRCSPVFSEPIKNFIDADMGRSETLRWMAEVYSEKILREGYQVWICLSLILLLHPSRFLKKSGDGVQATSKIIFFKEKDDMYNSNFAFYSKKLKAWIEFGFGMASKYPTYHYPNIWISNVQKSKKIFTYAYLSNIILLDSKENKGWIDRPLMRRYVNDFKQSTLFVVCWENESFHLSDSKIKILNNVDFDEEKLVSIVKALEANNA